MIIVANSSRFASTIVIRATNGILPASWAAESFQELFDRYIPGWREDNFSLRYALGIPKQELGGLQVVYAGKAHPPDQGGKEIIKRIFQAKEGLAREIKIACLENYDNSL